MEQKNLFWGYLCFILSAIAFGSVEVVSKVACDNHLVPIQINFAKYLIGTLVMLPWALPFLKAKLSVKDHLLFLVFGTMIAMSQLFVVMSIPRLGSAALAGLLFSTNPIFTVIFASWIAKEKGGKNLIPAVALGILGMAVLPLDRLLSLKTGLNASGLLLAFTAAVIFSAYTVFSKLENHRVNKYSSLFFSFFWTTVTLFITALVTGQRLLVPEMLTYPTFLALAWLGLFVAGLGYIFYFTGMEHLGVHKSTLTFFLKPVVAASLAALILGERISLNMLAGAGIVLLAMYLLFYEASPKESEKLEGSPKPVLTE